MPTKRELYTAKLDDITRRYLGREDALVKSGVELLRQLQKEIAAQLALNGTDAYQLSELKKSLERQITSLESQLSNALTNAAGQVYQDGGASVVEPLQAVGYSGVFFTPSQAQILTVSDFTADLIKGLTADMLTKINGQLRRAALGELSPFEVMKEITRLLGFQGKMVTGGVSYRAEMIIRTELARIFNLANYGAGLEATAAVPDLLKRWIATGDARTRESHLQAHAKYTANPIPFKDDFIVGGEALRFPGDPRGSGKMTVNCRCRAQAVVPEIGVLSSPLDRRVKTQIARRDKKVIQR